MSFVGYGYILTWYPSVRRKGAEAADGLGQSLPLPPVCMLAWGRRCGHLLLVGLGPMDLEPQREVSHHVETGHRHVGQIGVTLAFGVVAVVVGAGSVVA